MLLCFGVEMHNPVFHTLTLGNLHFEALMTDLGPYLGCRENGPLVSISPSLTVRYANKFEDMGPQDSGWWLVKYRSEFRINLTSLNDHQAQAFAAEFGFPIDPSMGAGVPDLFNRCPAWSALVEWAKKHPKLADRYRNANSSLDWHSQFLAELEAQDSA